MFQTRHAQAYEPRRLLLAAFAALALLPCATLAARADGEEAAPTPVPDLYKIVRVLEVSNADYVYEDMDEKDWTGRLRVRRTAGLNDRIIVRVRNLEALLLRAQCMPPFDKPDPCRPQEISLYINGRAIKGLKPESGAPELSEPGDPDRKNWVCGDAQHPRACHSGTLRYHLQRLTDEEYREDNQEHWADLLGLASEPWRWSLERRVDVSVGLADSYPVGTDVNDSAPLDLRFFLIRVRIGRLPFWILFLVLLFWGMRELTRRYDLMSDSTPVVWPAKRPYSLSAVQAAWWFFVILVSFIFILLVTGQSNFSETALALLGIGAGTALSAVIIDSSKRARDTTGDAGAGSPEELKLLLGQKDKLEAELNRLLKARRGAERTLRSLRLRVKGAEAQSADTKQLAEKVQAAEAEAAAKDADFKAKKDEYDQKIGEIRADFPKALGSPREGFLRDILSDDGGVSFHRFQMLVWTLTLGVFFMTSVLGVLAMPNFSGTLLGLLGLSAGTYLGFKIPENNSAATTPPNGGGGEPQGQPESKVETGAAKNDAATETRTETNETANGVEQKTGEETKSSGGEQTEETGKASGGDSAKDGDSTKEEGDDE